MYSSLSTSISGATDVEPAKVILPLSLLALYEPSESTLM